MQGTAAATFRIRVLLFASYAERLGAESLDLTLESPATIGDAVARLRCFPGGDLLPPKPLCALNLGQTSLETLLAPGDELAILPPLSGG
jgi:molybdopterin converting factor small subunit